MVAPLVYYERNVKRMSFINVPNVGMVENIDRDITRKGYKQKAPFNLDTTYSYVENQTLGGWSHQWPGQSVSKEMQVAATNCAKAKFVAQLGDQSQLGSTLTSELKATWGTVTSGVTKALGAANAVRRGNLVKASQILGANPPSIRTVVKRRVKKNGRVTRSRKQVMVMPDGRLLSQTSANYWLWYSYAIKPLVSDIHNAMDILTRPAPYHVIEAFCSAASARSEAFRSTKYTMKSSVSIKAHVRAANPNLWLANQLGLINPVQWINEGIPFSFVVDWFSNLSQIINQMTEFAGLEIAKPITTSKHVGTRTATYPEYKYLTCVTRTIYFDRSLSIPSAKFRVAYERFNWQRGANAISLLVGMMNKSTLR